MAPTVKQLEIARTIINSFLRMPSKPSPNYNSGPSFLSYMSKGSLPFMSSKSYSRRI